MSEWQPIATNPKDGKPFWAYLHQTGIRKLRWSSAEEASGLNGDPGDYDGAFCEVDDIMETWEPDWWLPLEAIPDPPRLETKS